MSTLTIDPFLGHVFATGHRTSVRLTRRGRLLIVVAALAVAFAVGVLVSAAGSAAAEHPGTAAPTRIVQVHDGDTLWQIASGLDTSDDVRTTMATIEQLNALSSPELEVGQRLVIPAG